MLSVAYFAVARGCLYSALVSVPQTMPVRHRSAAVLLSLLIAACATAHDKPLAAPAAMSCESLPAELEAERSAWQAPSANLGVAADAASARPVVTLVRTRLKLLPQAKLKPVALAKAEANPPNSFGGLMAFAPGRGGVFRVSTSERAWIELIDRSTGAPLAPISSDKRLRCFGVPKSLLFEIRPGHDYLLQITAAASPEVDLLIAQAAK